MALPALLRKLFKSSGYGSELNDGIISKIISNQDWSNSYDYPVGVVARGSDGDLYYSVAQSGPGTSAGAKDPAQGGNSGFWKSFGSGDSVPTGTVLWLSTPSVPAGYLLCNGAAVGRATYPELFTAIGTTYGAGDGSTTFNLPNLIDKFAEGSTVAGTAKDAGLPEIEGYVNSVCTLGVSDTWEYGCFTSYRDHIINSLSTGSVQNDSVRTFAFHASHSNPIYGNSDTVQPPALTLLPCIKAFASVVGDATVVAGQLVNDIQSKVALDGSNLSGATVKAVVETWHSGTEWYRVWSDGWIEQGGVIPSPNGSASFLTKTLPKQFSNTNYTLLVTLLTYLDSGTWARDFGAYDKTTTSFKTIVSSKADKCQGKSWYACGF